MSNVSTPIWQMPCAALDLVLGSGFDWKELENLLQRGRDNPGQCECSEGMMRNSDRVVHLAHSLCHREKPFSLLIQRQLDLEYRDGLLEIWPMDPGELRQHVLTLDLRKERELVSFVWSVCRDGRASTQELVPLLLSRIQVEAFRHLYAQKGDPVFDADTFKGQESPKASHDSPEFF